MKKTYTKARIRVSTGTVVIEDLYPTEDFFLVRSLRPTGWLKN